MLAVDVRVVRCFDCTLKTACAQSADEWHNAIPSISKLPLNVASAGEYCTVLALVYTDHVPASSSLTACVCDCVTVCVSDVGLVARFVSELGLSRGIQQLFQRHPQPAQPADKYAILQHRLS